MQDATKSLVATALAHFINDGTVYVPILLYPFLTESYGLSQTNVALLLSLTSVFSIAASPFIGRKSDSSQNFGYLMTLGIILISFGIFGFAFSAIYFSGFALFLFLVPFTLLIGVGSSFYHPLGAAILNEKWETNVRARAMGINGAFGSLGTAVFPIITVALVVSIAIPSVSFLGVLSLVVAFIIFSIMRSFEFLGNQKRSNLNKDIGKKTKAISMRALLPIILVLTVSAFLRGLSQGIVQFLPIYIHTVKQVETAYLGIAFSIMPLMGIFSQPIFGYISDRLGRRLAIGISGVGVAISMLLFLSTNQVLLSEIYLAVFGLFNFTSFPLILGLATEISPEGSTTIGSSIVWGVGMVGGGAVGPILVALFALPGSLGSLTGAFYAVTLIGVLSVVLLPLVPKSSTTDRGTHALSKGSLARRT